MTEEKLWLAQKRFGQNITDGFSLFKKTYKYLFLPMALFTILAVVLKVVLFTSLEYDSAVLSAQTNALLDNILADPMGDISEQDYNLIMQSLLISYGLTFLDNLVGAVCTVIPLCLVSSFVYKTYLRESPEFGKEVKKSLNSKIIGPLLLLGIGIPIGWLIIFIPAIILFGFFIFSVLTVNLEGSQKPITESRNIARGAFMKIIGVFFVCTFLIIIVGLILDLVVFTPIVNYVWQLDNATYNSWFAPATRNYGMIILYQLLYSVVDILLAPLFICLLTPLFASLKVQKEMGRDPRMRQAQYQQQYQQYQRAPTYGNAPQAQPIYQQGAPSPASEKGLFCPFCGEKVTTPKKFCPNCGESLNF